MPRGALFEETLDWLERLGVATGEVRANDRKLLFEDVGLITMRPSDVPTYVAAGAADIGVTGKDVLMEQSDVGRRRRAAATSTSCATSASAAARWSSRRSPARTRRRRRCGASA